LVSTLDEITPSLDEWMEMGNFFARLQQDWPNITLHPREGNRTIAWSDTWLYGTAYFNPTWVSLRGALEVAAIYMAWLRDLTPAQHQLYVYQADADPLLELTPGLTAEEIILIINGGPLQAHVEE
jgi:hypothetical protein